MILKIGLNQAQQPFLIVILGKGVVTGVREDTKAMIIMVKHFLFTEF